MSDECQNCGKLGAKMRERTDPKNFQAIRRRLCTPCGNRLGFQVPYGHAVGSSVLKAHRPN